MVTVKKPKGPHATKLLNIVVCFFPNIPHLKVNFVQMDILLDAFVCKAYSLKTNECHKSIPVTPHGVSK